MTWCPHSIRQVLECSIEHLASCVLLSRPAGHDEVGRVERYN